MIPMSAGKYVHQKRIGDLMRKFNVSTGKYTQFAIDLPLNMSAATKNIILQEANRLYESLWRIEFQSKIRFSMSPAYLCYLPPQRQLPLDSEMLLALLLLYESRCLQPNPSVCATSGPR